MLKRLILLMCILSLVQCSFTKIDVYDVINNSSYTVYMTDIQPPADKTEITLAPGETDQLTYEYNAITGYWVRFSYAPVDLVKCDIDMKKKKITFTNI